MANETTPKTSVRIQTTQENNYAGKDTEDHGHKLDDLALLQLQPARSQGVRGSDIWFTATHKEPQRACAT